MKIHFFWVGAAINEINDNTFFLIKDWKNNLQVDCWWWKKLTKNIKFNNIFFENIFITHKHSDHILWFFHLIRVFKWNLLNNLNIFCSIDIKNTIISISKHLWWKSQQLIESNNVNFVEINNKKEILIWDFLINPINLYSNKIEQFWFILNHNSKRILFFWDEAVWVLERNDLNNFIWVDYLLIEAICLDSMSQESWWTINTQKISHITSKQAWFIANLLKVKNLVLIHTMDLDIINRQELLIQDAKTEFDWNIIVPNAWDIINII